MLQDEAQWLLFFYTVPAKPGNLRTKVWRRLLKLGAVSFKGSVYLLPYSEEHVEALHWLTGEVAGLQGEAAFVKVTGIETMRWEEIVALFNSQRDSDYLALGPALRPWRFSGVPCSNGSSPGDWKNSRLTCESC